MPLLKETVTDAVAGGRTTLREGAVDPGLN